MAGKTQNLVSVAALAVSSIALGGVLATLVCKAAGRSRNEEPATARRPRRRRRQPSSDSSDTDEEMRPRRSKKTSNTPNLKKYADNDDTEFLGMNVGFSMEEARNLAEEGHAVAKNRSPQEVLVDLQKGNARFWTGTALRPEKTAFQRRALISKQYPSVAILGCSDSRVPVEIVFDQGLGDMFVIRVAGNCLDTATTASLQYATHHLKVKVLVVMGHEGCGAVKAAQLPIDAINSEPASLGSLLTRLRGGLNLDRLGKVQDAKSHDREAVVTNVKRQVERLTEDAAVMAKVNNGELMIVGAFYEISSGIVDFFYEVSEGTPCHNDLSPVTRAEERRPSRGVLTRFGSILDREEDDEAS